MKDMRIFNKIKKLALTSILLFALATPAFASAAPASPFSAAKNEACSGAQLERNVPCDVTAQDTLSTTLGKIIDLLTVVVGIICVIMIIISGIRFITAHGDSNSIASARNTLLYALIGLVVVAFAQVIVKLVLTKI